MYPNKTSGLHKNNKLNLIKKIPYSYVNGHKECVGLACIMGIQLIWDKLYNSYKARRKEKLFTYLYCKL